MTSFLQSFRPPRFLSVFLAQARMRRPQASGPGSPRSGASGRPPPGRTGKNAAGLRGVIAAVAPRAA